MGRLSYAVLCLLLFLGFSATRAQDTKRFLLAAHRAGNVEVIDPETLATVANIHFDLAPQSSGLNGVAASADGSTLYVEGAVPPNPSCCGIYAVDLATMKTVTTTIEEKFARQNSPLIFSGGLVYPAAELMPGGPTHDHTIASRNARLLLSPDGRWLFGVRSFRGPALETFDLKNGAAFRELTPAGLPDDSGSNWANGAWSGDRFYLYVGNGAKGGRLWTVSPGAEQLGSAVDVTAFGDVPGCRQRGPVVRNLTVAAGHVFVYEPFGSKADRSSGCSTVVPGGAWMVNPATGQLVKQIASEFHFNHLVADQSGAEIYGLDPGNDGWTGPVRLVRMHASDGAVLKSRTLDPGVCTIAAAPLRSAPLGDVHIRLGIE